MEKVSKAFIINNNNEILILKQRSNNKWHLPGGGVEENENYEQALKRELKEELKYIKFKYKFFKDFKYTKLYFIYEDDLIPKLSIEHKDYMWVKPNRAFRIQLTDNSKEYIKLLMKYTNIR